MFGFNRTQIKKIIDETEKHKPFSMAELLINAEVATSAKPEAHRQVDTFQAELADRIAKADWDDDALTKRIDFLLEERRQVRVVRDGLYAAHKAAFDAVPAISEAALAAELQTDYADHEAYL